MRERGDLDVLHEPFLYYYYLSSESPAQHLQFADFDPDPQRPISYADIRADILHRSSKQPVFFKDMAFYIVDRLSADDEFAAAATHTFLIRDPAESIVSYYHRDPNFTCTEVGLEAQWQLFQWLRDNDHQPRVVTADEIKRAPEQSMARYWQKVDLIDMPSALQWQSTTPDDWKSVAAWHGDAINSGAIRAPDNTRDYRAELAELGQPYTDFEKIHRPFYDLLLQVNLTHTRT